MFRLLGRGLRLERQIKKMESQHMDAKKVAIAGITLAFGTTGCVTTKIPDLAYVEASDVIDSLKDELAEVAKNPIDKQVLVAPDACGVEDGDHKMVHVTIGFETADVTLKTVATDTLTGTAAAAKIPLGVVLVGFSGSLTRTTIRTQQVTYTLGKDNRSIAERKKSAPTVKNKEFKPGQGGYIPIHRVGESQSKQVNGEAAAPVLHPIADAILAARDQILAIDHARRPCLLPTKVKVEIDFQVQRKLDVKGDVGFLVFADVGGESITQRETANSMTVTYSLAGSSVGLY
jgi:hypothetical protein